MRTIAQLGLIIVLLAAIFIVAAKELPNNLAAESSTPQTVSTLVPKALIPSPSEGQGGQTSTGSGSSTSSGNNGNGSNVTTSSTSNETSNWAGYVATGGNYTSVSGSWVVPSPSANGINSADAAWVGIGGVTSNDLIQAGTQNFVSANGDVQTAAFYELLPDTSVDLSSISVNSGDSVSVTVSQISSGEWSIYFIDNTNGQSSTTNVYYDSSLSSADWIEEDPSDGIGQIPFDDFGSISFSDCQTTVNASAQSISSANGQALTMVSGDGSDLATTSSLDGNGFTVNEVGDGANQINQDFITPDQLYRRATAFLNF